METLYEEAQLKEELMFFEWPHWIKRRMTEYFYERRRMAVKTQLLKASGEMPESKQLSDFQVFDTYAL